MTPIRENVVKLGSFAKFIKMASRIYLLPLKVDYKLSSVEFNLLSLNTLVNFILYSLPFFVIATLWLWQAQYITEVFYALPEIYSKIDLGAWLIYPGINLVPLPLFLINCLNCKSFAAVKGISSDEKLKFPKNSGIVVLTVIINFIRCDIGLMI